MLIEPGILRQTNDAPFSVLPKIIPFAWPGLLISRMARISLSLIHPLCHRSPAYCGRNCEDHSRIAKSILEMDEKIYTTADDCHKGNAFQTACVMALRQQHTGEKQIASIVALPVIPPSASHF